ncbi:MAG: C45 family autoproteolytic acyltransferase/hydrolase, partial [Roseimicrobium sp.]
EVWIANENAPDQLVIGGGVQAIAEMEVRLSTAGFEAKILPVARPFHTPLMADAKAPYREVLAQTNFLPPRVPILSSVTNRYVADPADIRENLVEQLTLPVRYVDLIQRLSCEGVTVFIEIGPRQVLTQLHRRILAGASASCIATDAPKRPGAEQLLRVRAMLDSLGVTNDEPIPQQVVVAPRGPIAAIERQEIVHFDATARRRERMRREVASLPEARMPQVSPLPSVSAASELETFLINFVCEQTGYPPEVVDLDADMEADLGIDSIKKAQLFGELREHFDVQITGTVTLASFPTLRHVADFLSTAERKQASLVGSSTKPVAAESSHNDAPSAPASPGPHSTIADPKRLLNVVSLAGTPYEMGFQHGRSQSAAIHHALDRYASLMGPQLERIGDLLDMLGQPDKFVDEPAMEELRGLADGLEMPPDKLVTFNVGLGLYSDYLPGCSQFALTGRANGDEGMIHAANEDWALALVLSQCLRRVVQVRRPAQGLSHVFFSICGQMGGLNGMNEKGVAVTSTLLLDRRSQELAQTGLIHTILVRKILEGAEDLEGAIAIVRQAKKTGAWSLCLSHAASDKLCYLEYDGDSLELRIADDRVASTNHCLSHAPISHVPEHSQCRMSRLLALLDAGENGPVTVERAQRALRDRFDLGRGRVTEHPTMNTIRRADTQLSVVMKPKLGELWITAEPGPRHGDPDRFYKLSLADLFSTAAVRAGDDSGHPVMGRYVLRMVDAPSVPKTGPLPLHGSVVILGANAWALALQDRFASQGANVVVLPTDGAIEETLAALEAAWQHAVAPHLFLATARDETAALDGSPTMWSARLARGVMLPCLVSQRWLKLVAEANLLNKATLFATTALGGDFGFSSAVRTPEAGAITGLLKAVRREFESLRVTIVDTPASESPKAVAEALCHEFVNDNGVAEVAYVRGRRRLVQTVPHQVPPLAVKPIPRGGTWVVTGGGGGITAVVARELGARFGLKLHLLGRSPQPQVDPAWRDLSAAELKQLKLTVATEARSAGRDPAEARRNLEKTLELDSTLTAMADAGVTATYHCCDVTDRGALSATLERIRAQDGPIQGIIHGAGIEQASRFDRKTRDGIETTMDAKVDGAAALMELTAGDPVEYFVGFGSVSGRFGGQGQTDYSMASDMLAKLVAMYRSERPTCAAVAIHWPAWAEVGMAMRPESRLVLEMSEQSFMPPLEGVGHLIAELEAGAPEAEVVFTGEHSGSLDLDHTLPSLVERQAYRRRDALLPRLPLVAGVHGLHEPECLVAELRFEPAHDVFLTQHRHRGVPILPACVGIECLVEAASLLSPEKEVVGVRDVEVINGYRFFSERRQHASVLASMHQTGVRCELVANFYDREGRLTDPQRVYMSGSVELADARERIVPDEMQPPGETERWVPMEYVDLAQSHELGRVFLGPPLRCVRLLSHTDGGGWARLVAPPIEELSGGRPSGWLMPAALLDGCFQVCGAFAWLITGLPPMPRSVGWLRFGRQARSGEACLVLAKFRGQEDGHALFDFELRGEDGEIILWGESFRIVLASKP